MSEALPLGAPIGILGGGQLGRMTALAAARLGHPCHVYAPEEHGPAADVSRSCTRAAWDDGAALERFAASVAVVTLEFENVPVAALERLGKLVPVRPGPAVLRVTQDRRLEKSFANELGLGTAPWAEVSKPKQARAARAKVPGAAILKTATLGYDGKGQASLDADATAGDVEAAWRALGSAPCVLEGRVGFVRELSVIVARGLDGAMVSYPAAENRHEDGILRETMVPCASAPEVVERARLAAEKLAEALDVRGLLAVEMFETLDGEVLINEMAPRPHNSGHWSMDAAACSQFEQLVRAVCGHPLGDPSALTPARMLNLLGDEAGAAAAYLSDPAARLHLYGKAQAKPGRKMGHVNFVGAG